MTLSGNNEHMDELLEDNSFLSVRMFIQISSPAQMGT